MSSRLFLNAEVGTTFAREGTRSQGALDSCVLSVPVPLSLCTHAAFYADQAIGGPAQLTAKETEQSSQGRTYSKTWAFCWAGPNQNHKRTTLALHLDLFCLTRFFMMKLFRRFFFFGSSHGWSYKAPCASHSAPCWLMVRRW